MSVQLVNSDNRKNTSLTCHKQYFQSSMISLMQQKHLSLSWIRTLCQRLISSLYPKTVFLASKHLSSGQFSSVLLMSPNRSVVAPVPTTVTPSQSTQPSLDKRSSSCRLARPKMQQPYSGACGLEPLSGLQNTMVPTKSRRSWQKKDAREDSETVTEHNDSHHGAVSFRRRVGSAKLFGM